MDCNCNNIPSELITHLTTKAKQYLEVEESDEKITWCGACGNYGIQKALIRALTLENIRPWEALLCYDIGCNGNGSDKIGAYTIHGLHGRVISLAAGAALANQKLEVIASAGDGATFSEGVNHLIHGVRNDYPITFLHHNNSNYGLTTGQASATTRKGQMMNGTPDGVVVDPINPVEIVLALGPTFVARTFSGDVKHMTEMIRRGIHHPGFAFIEILQTCPTYNKATTQKWFWDRIKYIEDVKGYDASDIWAARKIAQDMDNEIMLGVLYENPQPSFAERLIQRQGKKTSLVEEVAHFNVSEIMKEME